MSINKPKYEQFYWVLIWLGVSAISWYLVYLKYLALDFHTRDYAFYTEFIVKWSKPVSEQYYSINPGGYNFLGVSTEDGCKGFYQWIHVEPIRFLQAFIYKIFHSLQAVFIFNALVICSPILTISLWLKKASPGFWEKIIWILFFIAFPATLLTAGYDNRPSMFLGVGYCWILYFLLGTKNKWGQYISFLFLFLIREEAIILNGIICLYIFFEWRKKAIPMAWLLAYGAIYLLYAILLLVYYQYWGTALFQKQTFYYSYNLLGVLFLICVGWLYYMLAKKKPYQILFLPIVFFLFQVISMYYSNILPDDGFSYFNDPRNSFWFICVLAFFLYIRAAGSKTITIAIGVLAVFFFIFPLLHGDHILSRMNHEKNRIAENKILFEIEKQLSSSDTVITDYYTHQAFIGRNNLYCFQRIPCTIDKTQVRFFPENIKFLQNFFRKGNWILVHHSSLELLKNASLVNESYILSKNNKYVILRVN